MKTCTKCRIEKPLSEFGKKASSPDGIRCHCKLCHALLAVEYRTKNPDKVAALGARWRMNNSDKKRNNDAAYYSANSAKIKLATAKWAAANHDRVLEMHVNWAKNNPEKRSKANSKWAKNNKSIRRAHKQNRRARLRASSGTLSKNIFEMLFVRQQGVCKYCGTDLSAINPHLDHRMPLKLGGLNIDENMQLLCCKCNLKKGAKHPDDFERAIGYKRQSGSPRPNPADLP